MIKTEIQIERDFYSFVENSDLGKAIEGKVYRSEMRPADAKTEDLVIKFLAGLDGQIQTGVVILNLYVPDIPFGSDGKYAPNKSRIGELEELILSFIESAGDDEYLLESDGSPSTVYNDEIEQHFIYSRIKFQRSTF